VWVRVWVWVSIHPGASRVPVPVPARTTTATSSASVPASRGSKPLKSTLPPLPAFHALLLADEQDLVPILSGRTNLVGRALVRQRVTLTGRLFTLFNRTVFGNRIPALHAVPTPAPVSASSPPPIIRSSFGSPHMSHEGHARNEVGGDGSVAAADEADGGVEGALARLALTSSPDARARYIVCVCVCVCVCHVRVYTWVQTNTITFQPQQIETSHELSSLCDQPL
jgi:hypothetical protein